MANSNELLRNRYSLGDILGKGSYGKVYVLNDTKDLISKKAIKQILVSSISVKQAFSIAQEALTLSKLDHPFIIKYYDSFHDGDYFYIITELCEKVNLYGFIKQSVKSNLKFSDENKMLKWLKQCVSAVKYLHDKDILHRDIKPLNMFQINENIKLGDFGLSITVDEISHALSNVGTSLYKSPEMLKRQPYNSTSDIWALGTSFYQLSVFKFPFESENDILNASYVDLPFNFSRIYNELIKRMLAKDPKERVSANKIDEYLKINFKIENTHLTNTDCRANGERKQEDINSSRKNEIIIGARFKSVKKVDVPAAIHLGRMTLIENNTKLLIAEFVRNLLHICDLDGNLLKSFKPIGMIHNPLGLCAANKEIYISDGEMSYQISVYDMEFNLKRKFGNSILNPEFLRVDEEHNNLNLYVSDCDNNEISIWNVENGEFINKINIDTPMQLNFTKTSLFVTSAVIKAELFNNKVDKIIKGNNCIFEIDKVSLELKRKIVGNWFSPSQFYISNANYSYIIAYSFDKNQFKSECKYLFKIDMDGQILNKIQLNDVKGIHDVVCARNKLIISQNKTLSIFEF